MLITIGVSCFSDSQSMRLLRFGLHDTFTEEVGDQEYLRKYYHMSASDVVEEVVRYCKEGKL